MYLRLFSFIAEELSGFLVVPSLVISVCEVRAGVVAEQVWGPVRRLSVQRPNVGCRTGGSKPSRWRAC